MKDNNKKIIWEKLSQEEKQNYLMFWFHYYNGNVYTLEELGKFREVIKSKADDVYDHICTLSLLNNTIKSTLLTCVISKNKLDELFSKNINKENIKNLKISEKDKKNLLSDVEETRSFIINEIDKAYKNPEPNNYTLLILKQSKS